MRTLRRIWRRRAWHVADAWAALSRELDGLIRPLLVVAWCMTSRSHFIEPWGPATDDHSGCSSCTWCEDCGSLLGRPSEEIGLP